MNIYTIYKATNKINGKCYIGFDSNWPNRMNDHRRKYIRYDRNHKSVFYDAISKHSWDNFEWEILYQSKELEYTKNVMEKYFITEYNTYCGFDNCMGYNMTLGGEGTFGNILSEKTKYLLSEKSKQRFASEENRKEHSEKMRNWYNNLSENNKKETSKKISNSLLGNKRAVGMTYTHTEEAKEKISKVHKGKVIGEAQIDKIRISRIGKGMGERNSMANLENRKKVAQSKIGRKKYINIETKSGKYCYPGTEPDGYILASLVKK